MKQKAYNWYEWHWKQNPPTNEEKQKTATKLIDLLLRKGNVSQLIGRWQEAEKIYYGCIDIAVASDDKKSLADSKANLGRLLGSQGDYSEAINLLREAQEL